MNLTQRTVESTKAPLQGQRFIRDDEVKGLAVRITANDSKSFVWEGRIKGRVRRITLGPWPALTVQAARRKALDVRASIINGDDPAFEREQERNEVTFRFLAEAYFERHAKPHKRSWREDERLLKRYVPKSWDSRRLSDLRREDFVKLHAKVGDENGQSAANHLMRLLRAMFNLARDWGMLDGENPAVRIKLFAEEKRERFLSPDELRRVNEALLQETNAYWRAYFPLALMLGTRRTELLSARWRDIDLEQRTWRIPETKDGESHLLPLPKPAAAILESLPSFSDRSEWVFPASSSSGHIVEPAKAWQRIRARAGVPDVRIHDLRHTLASWMVGQGYNLPLIGRALNHSQVSTTQRYAHLTLDPVRAALEQTASLMFGDIETPMSGEMLPVRLPPN